MFAAMCVFVIPEGCPSPVLVITRQEAAQALGVDPRTITVGIEDGTIPSVKLGRRVVIPREKFLRLFADDSNEDRP